MVKALRRDLFTLSEDDSLPIRYVILKKLPPNTENQFLEQVLIAPSSLFAEKERSPYTIGTIIDQSLYETIEDGDIGLFTGHGSIRVMLTARANHNTLLVTERCNNLCLFCSQPPKDRDDGWLLAQAAMAIAAFGTAQTIGISGGEPLLYRQSFIRFLDVIAEYSPKTPLHILSNGRAFSDANFTYEIAKRCEYLSITFGVPLYSAISSHHDRLVGAKGSYLETLKGLINAGNSGIPLELRFIPTAHNIHDMEATVSLVVRCLSRLAQISIMNLEPTGWAKHNWNQLYVAPGDYDKELGKAVKAAERACVQVCLFNYPLCHLPDELHPYAVKSISDWKNYYPDECEGCRLRKECGGYFVSSRGLFHESARRVT